MDSPETEAQETAVKFGILIGLLSLAASFVLGFFLEAHAINWLPESGVAVLVGVLACSLVSFAEDAALMSTMRFDMDFFMNWLIPPIIFEAAFNMNVSAFFTNITPTVFFAFVGTVLSTFIVAGVVFGAGFAGWCYPLSPLASLTFGSLISATDPVAVLATFQALGVSPDLFSMVFGESVLNDAVAIVLTRTLVSFATEEATLDSVASAFLAFLQIFLGSSAIGLGFGVLSALVFKHLKLRDHAETVFLEVVLSFTFPWSAYFLCEAVHYSGIVAILFCGMVFATYTRVNVSEPGLQLMAGTFKCIAKIAETFVFVYLGMACVRMAKIGLFAGTVWRLAGFGILACFLGRLHIFLGSWLVNRSRTPSSVPPPISGESMLIMWLSGLRGGVAFAIAVVLYKDHAFPDHCGGRAFGRAAVKDCRGESVTNDATAILQMTMLIAVFTTFCLGGLMPTLARHCDILVGEGSPSQPSSRELSTHGGSSCTPSLENGSSKNVLDNKAAPLLHAKTAGALLSRTSPVGSSLTVRHVEESHSWLVRFLTHEENYTYLAEEQDQAGDRFIGRGSLHLDHVHSSGTAAMGRDAHARRPAPLRRWKSHGSFGHERSAPLYQPPPLDPLARPPG